MDIRVEQHQQTVVISLAGSFDAVTAGQAECTIGTQLDTGQQPVVLDLSRVDFMSSSGIRVLLTLLKKSQKLGGGFCLAAPQPGVQRTLEIAGLVRVLQVYPSLEEAVRSFNSLAP